MSVTLSPAEAQVTSIEGPSRAATNGAAWLNGPSPLEFSWGSFNLHPRFSEIALYDDNIEYVPTNRDAAMANDVAVGFRLVGGDRTTLLEYEEGDCPVTPRELSTSYLITQPPETWPDPFVVLDYYTQWQLYTRYKKNNSWDQFVTADGEWPMARLVAGVLENYSDQKTLVIDGAVRTEVRQDQTEVNASYQLVGKLSLDSAIDFQDVAYPEYPSLSNYQEGKAFLSLNRQADDRLVTSLTGAIGVDNVENGVSQQFEDLGGRIQYNFGKFFYLDVLAGAEYRHFDSDINATLTPYCYVGLTNSPTTSTTLGLTVGRQQFPSLYDNYYYMDTGGDVSLRQQLTRSLSVGLLVSYYLTDDKPARRVDNTHGSQDYYAIRVSTLWQLDRYFKTELFYVYCGSGLSERNLVVQENQVGMELHLNF